MKSFATKIIDNHATMCIKQLYHLRFRILTKQNAGRAVSLIAPL